MTTASLFDTIDSSIGLDSGPYLSQSIWDNIYDDDENYADDVAKSDVSFNFDTNLQPIGY